MKTPHLTFRCLALLLGALGLCGAPGIARADNKPTAAIVYVESNRAQNNSVLAFERTAKGELRLLQEYATGGKGIFDTTLALGPFDSDQNIIVNPERSLLFAVNSGSNTIAVFNINADGSLHAVAGSPFPSGGINPVSLGLSKDVLVVVNKAMDPGQPGSNQPSYVTLPISPEGVLGAPISTVLAPVGSSPSQAAISPSMRLAVDAQFMGGALQTFVVGGSGTLTPVQTQALPDSAYVGSSAPHLPLGLAMHPKQPILYVGLVTIDRLAVYTYDGSGHVSFQGSVADSGSAPCWVKVNGQGTRAYVSNTGDNSISVYDITSPLHPVEIQKLNLRGVGSCFQMELDPQEDYLYVVTQRADPATPIGKGNTLHALKIKPNTGELNETGSSPVELALPLGTRPQGLATSQRR
ncbi:MAG: beta-propeller fold lactonase family protein [Opitutaceae bacterium]